MFRQSSRAWARDLILGAGVLCAALALLLYPTEAMEGAKQGLRLCYNVIIPSLFPFFVLSALVVELGLAAGLGRMLEGIMRPLFRVDGVCASAFVLGAIGGYPVGAKTAIDLYQQGMCSKTEAERLLAFCNNSGPAFILGVVGTGVFSSGRVGLLLYLTHAAASLCVGILFRFYKGAGGRAAGTGVRPQFQAKRFPAALTRSVQSAASSALNICAFVVFFTVTIRLLSLSGAMAALSGALSVLPGLDRVWAERLLTGLLEISSGVWTLSGDGPLPGRLSMAAFLLGWAGISVHCQVLSFLGESGLSAKTYLAGKALHGILASALTALAVRMVPLEAPAAALLSGPAADMVAGPGFGAVLSGSAASAGGLLLGMLLLIRSAGKRSVHRRSGVI
ncbi:nucleoside recognition domain-containing protein [Pseudoflavonifractor sp. MSJ-37]|uniref:nucleoside recognition domain-containing protein n=1 Tax=Pseudoflavonifractor sp. MSJ-37 TaxID=2841531 RepID=UPI001C11439B|nr:nucleoside recognition domain-containing protein [Pseudoflavonifractor sp. MSJ-37]MBU5436322.1 sporulation protein [Pseudoflavonifractor sp. MSJ-37]